MSNIIFVTIFFIFGVYYSIYIRRTERQFEEREKELIEVIALIMENPDKIQIIKQKLDKLIIKYKRMN